MPCGGGVAFRALAPDQDVRYTAGDLSEKMLARARRRARGRSPNQIEVLAADMTGPQPGFAAFTGHKHTG